MLPKGEFGYDRKRSSPPKLTRNGVRAVLRRRSHPWRFPTWHRRDRPAVSEIRKSFRLNRKLFSRLVGYSERAVAKWESGIAPSGAGLQKMNEICRLHQALVEVIKPDFVPHWLQSPNDAFGGLKPIEVVERGEIDRIWRMVYMLESGTPG